MESQTVSLLFYFSPQPPEPPSSHPFSNSLEMIMMESGTISPHSILCRPLVSPPPGIETSKKQDATNNNSNNKSNSKSKSKNNDKNNKKTPPLHLPSTLHPSLTPPLHHYPSTRSPPSPPHHPPKHSVTVLCASAASARTNLQGSYCTS